MTHLKKVVIVGAGDLGINVLKNFIQNYEKEFFVEGLLDDDISKKHTSYYGKPILGTLSELNVLLSEVTIDFIVLAISNIQPNKKQSILKVCADQQVKVKTIPGIKEWIKESNSYKALEDVTPQDLLGRNSVNLLTKELTEQIEGKTVLVTGAGGSIGSEICRQVLLLRPQKLILVGHGENSIHQLLMELNNPIIVPVIADIQDKDELERVFKTYQPAIVYHAAAHKHVPLMEGSLSSAFKNNFLGTKNVADICEESDVEACVMISTDKAVKPANNMGRTKRLAEMYMQYMAKKSACNFSVVRFGNVLDSRGSVVPIFTKQLKEGMPITLTHRDMTRYFMTIPEAASLVLKAGSLAKTGEIYVLDMGEPIKILDLAQNLIRLSGHSLEDVPIIETGIRPGEKLTEELLSEGEIQEKNIVDKIHVGKAIEFDEERLLLLAHIGKKLSESELFHWINELTKISRKKTEVVQS